MRTKKISILFFALFVFALSTTVSAKFWGSAVTAEYAWSDGNCAWITKCSTYYVLWIPVNSECVDILIGC